MATAHNRAQPGEIAPEILLPGDPRRAAFIAENFLSDAVLFNDVRNMLGYTGYYNGRRISVMGTGMGIPSISIYITELFESYGVKTAVRIGTCGSGLNKKLRIGDLVLAEGFCTTSAINRRIFDGTYCPAADFGLLRTAWIKAKERGQKVTVGPMLSSDQFYPLTENPKDRAWYDFGVLGVEMEGAALYTLAKKYGVRALAMCTVSDSQEDPEGMTPAQRERSLTDMIRLALDTVSEQGEC